MRRLKLYHRLASWWPLLSDPADYREESGLYHAALVANATGPLVTVLELGSGGGNNASHLKQHFRMTLVDLSARMLAVSRQLNPGCEHVRGDMRTVRLGRTFDAVFIHDAIAYLATRSDLARAIETAHVHCRPGGLALFVPDCTTENFAPGTSHGGHDRGDRGLRYLEWTVDDDPGDESYTAHMSYLVREKGRVRCAGVDAHRCGLFADATWLRIISGAGFVATRLPYDHSEFPEGGHFLYLGRKA